ncbi:uncharacterized protein LOC129981570 [Argiope bruennichi]|uniref:uncharacterized protein LOC129981570 n=1 Tax=Argiope bruennichi TaxID=94029 RepID=UPI0024940B70|nr:uncharacterized protein LOC129981570 [Argiope bruennichi]XP_055948443.1 uncharacterized protein LOC129981570 [Argiope bruennichi]
MAEDVYDLCIVGAGMFGSAAARHASTNSRLKVCLIGPREPTVEESKDRKIFSSHYDEGRIVQIMEENTHLTVLSKHSISRFPETEKMSGIKFYNPVGFLLASEKENKNMINLTQTLLSHNIPFLDLSDNDAFKKRFPYLQLESCDCRLFDANGAGYVSARKLVEAQKKVASSQGCKIIEDIVCEVNDLDGGIHKIITEKNKIIKAKKVLICAGAFTNYNRLQPVGKVKMIINKETVAMLRLSEQEAKNLSSMPSMTYFMKRDDLPHLLNGAYILPPMQYPDGQYYLKAGRDGILPRSTEPSLEEVQKWYNNDGDVELVDQLLCLLKQLLPNVKFEQVGSKTCLTCHNSTGLPYVDCVTPTISIAAVGNGCGAVICDEIGRIAAELSTSGKWVSELPKSLFEARLE